MNRFLTCVIAFILGGLVATLIDAQANQSAALNPMAHQDKTDISADWPVLCHGHTEEVFERITLLESSVRQIKKQLKIQVK